MNADTLPDLFRQQADRLGLRVALRFKKDGLYRDLRWSEYRDQVEACAAALVQHGIQPGDRVAILAENRLEWLVADMAILAAGAVKPLAAAEIASWRAVADALLPRLWQHLRCRAPGESPDAGELRDRSQP